MRAPAAIVFRDVIDTDLGAFTAGFTEIGLAELAFPSTPTRGIHTVEKESVNTVVSDTRTALRTMIRGEVPDRIPRFDLSVGTAFQQSIWRALIGIPLGHPINYAELADRVGCAGGARAAGSACGANPIPVIIPCHRVVAANGRLGGFSGGLEWKIRLLEIEGFFLSANPAGHHSSITTR